MQGVIVTGERLFSRSGRTAVLARIESREVRMAIAQIYEVLDQSVAAQEQARLLMLRAAQDFPEIKLLRTVPGVGPIGRNADCRKPSARLLDCLSVWARFRDRKSPEDGKTNAEEQH